MFLIKKFSCLYKETHLFDLVRDDNEIVSFGRIWPKTKTYDTNQVTKIVLSTVRNFCIRWWIKKDESRRVFIPCRRELICFIISFHHTPQTLKSSSLIWKRRRYGKLMLSNFLLFLECLFWRLRRSLIISLYEERTKVVVRKMIVMNKSVKNVDIR